MPSITGIELGPDSCVLVSARSLEDAAEVSALHLIERAEWPQHDLAQTTMLRAIRRRKRLPRRANVVAWGLDEPAPANAPHVRSLLKPVIASGFRIEKVMTPPEALATLSRTRPRMHGAAVAWLALNIHGAAIAIVRDGELLFSRTFQWTYMGGVLGTRAELLQRYSLVSHLAPELRRGIMSVRSSYGAIVETIITSGDLPDLRSLTMPLIEELDLEVETLDSTEGLLSAATARNDRFAESAPALRLAVAAAISGVPLRRRGRRSLPPVLKLAAAAVIVASVAWLGQRYWKATEVRPVGERVAAAPAPVTQNARTATVPQTPRTIPPVSSSALQQQSQSSVMVPPVSTPAVTTPPVTAPAVAKPPVTTSAAPTPPVTTPPVTTPLVTPPPVRTSQAPPLPKPAAPSPVTPSPASSPPAVQTNTTKSVPQPAPPASSPLVASPPKVTSPPIASETTKPAPAAPAPQVSTPVPRDPERPARDPSVSERASKPSVAKTRPPVPLKEAVPSLESVLIAKDRRVAIVGGAIVSVGDSVGSRVVSQIDRDSVVLTEPSGYEIRVRLRHGPGTD